MTERTPMKDFILFFRNATWDKALTREEIDSIMEIHAGWYLELEAAGLTDGGMRLRAEGRLLRQARGGLLVDGPFVESKEAVAGYLHVRAENLDGAIAIARGWPGLKNGLTVEVRPVVPGRSE